MKMRHLTIRHIATLLLLLIAIQAMGKTDSLLWVGVKQTGIVYQQGHRDSALVMARRLLTVAENQDDDMARISLHNLIGYCLVDQVRKEAAIKEFVTCADIAEANGFLGRAVTTKSDFLFQAMLPTYALLAILCKDVKRKDESLRYARTGMEWITKCDNPAIRASALQPIAEVLMDHQEYALIYEPMKQGAKDAVEQNKPDFALLLLTYLINIEYKQFHRPLDEIPWIKIGEKLLPLVKTETAKTAFLAATRLNLQTSPNLPIISSPNLHKTSTDPSQRGEGLRASESSRPSSPLERPGEVPVRIGIVGIILVLTLLCFALYILWQRRQRRKTARETEQQMAERYLEGQERERSRLAKELHDGVSNQLLAIEMKLEQDGLTPQTMQLISESREQVRRVSHELIPPEFEHATLDEAVRSYTATLNGVRHCTVSYQSTPEDANWTLIPSATALEVYRIIQEVTGNALKHAKATSITIGLHLDEDKSITATVCDNGSEVMDNNKSTGIGIRTIRQRASAIGGQVDYYRHPFGTTVKLSVRPTTTAK